VAREIDSPEKNMHSVVKKDPEPSQRFLEAERKASALGG